MKELYRSWIVAFWISRNIKLMHPDLQSFWFALALGCYKIIGGLVLIFLDYFITAAVVMRYRPGNPPVFVAVASISACLLVGRWTYKQSLKLRDISWPTFESQKALTGPKSLTSTSAKLLK